MSEEFCERCDVPANVCGGPHVMYVDNGVEVVVPIESQPYCHLHKCDPAECRGRHEAIARSGFRNIPPNWEPLPDSGPVSRGMWQMIEPELPPDYFKFHGSPEERSRAAGEYLWKQFGEPKESEREHDVEPERDSDEDEGTA